MKNISIVDVLLQYRYSSTTMKVIGRYLKMHETRCEFGVERTKNALMLTRQLKYKSLVQRVLMVP